MPKRNRVEVVAESSDEEYISDSPSESSSDSSGSMAEVVPENIALLDDDKDQQGSVGEVDSDLKKKLLYDKAFLFTLSKKLKQQIDLEPERFENSVVDISNVFLMDDHEHPWLARTTSKCFGSGFILEYKGQILIMTNAHVAEMATFLDVRLPDDSKKYTAKLRHLDHDCDLAVLDVDDAEFWSKVKPLQLAEMPSMRSPLAVVGFPRQGEELCITEGTISRVEVDTYCHGGVQLLQAQVTAPINPGNSGGPAINPRGECVGVAFQGAQGDGEGFIIPSLIVRRFLDDLLNPNRPYQGFPQLPFTVQGGMQNPMMKKYYGVEDDIGIVVAKIDKLSGLKDILMPQDLLIALDGTPIKNDGTVETSFSKRMHFDYLVTQKQIGETICATVIRDGEKLELDLPLLYRANTTRMTGNFKHDMPPTYFIVCGVVLQVVTDDLLDEMGNDALNAAARDEKKLLGEELVVISEVFETEYTKKYDFYAVPLRRITHVNGVKIHNIREALAAVENNTEEMHVLRTKGKHYIPLKNISHAEHMQLLKPLRIDKDRSDDLLVPQVFMPGCPEYGKIGVTRPKKKLKT
jgi:S1-C subfamily serine protease